MHRYKFIISLLSILFFSFSSANDDRIITVQSTGVAKGYENAIRNAYDNAIANYIKRTYSEKFYDLNEQIILNKIIKNYLYYSGFSFDSKNTSVDANGLHHIQMNIPINTTKIALGLTVYINNFQKTLYEKSSENIEDLPLEEIKTAIKNIKIMQYVDQTDSLELQISNLEEKLEKEIKKSKQKDDQISRLNKEMSDKNFQIVKLEKQLKSANNKINLQQTELLNKSNRITKMEKEISENEFEIDGLQNRLMILKEKNKQR